MSLHTNKPHQTNPLRLAHACSKSFGVFVETTTLSKKKSVTYRFVEISYYDSPRWWYSFQVQFGGKQKLHSSKPTSRWARRDAGIVNGSHFTAKKTRRHSDNQTLSATDSARWLVGPKKTQPLSLPTRTCHIHLTTSPATAVPTSLKQYSVKRLRGGVAIFNPHRRLTSSPPSPKRCCSTIRRQTNSRPQQYNGHKKERPKTSRRPKPSFSLSNVWQQKTVKIQPTSIRHRAHRHPII